MDFLISRDTIKQQQFILKTPSHFIDQTNLIESSLTTEPFAARTLAQELSNTDLSQTELKGPSPLRNSILINTTSERNLDNSVVDEGPLVKSKQARRREDRVNTTPPSVCPCDGTLPRGSCRDGGSCPCSLQKSPGNQMDVTVIDGLDDTKLLVTDVKSQRKTRSVRKWVVQADGSYKSIDVEEHPVHPNVCSILNRSMKPVERRPGVFLKTWGIIATLIKQQEQLNVSHNNTADNSIADNSDFTGTASEGPHEESPPMDFDDTLETEHDVFSDFTGVHRSRIQYKQQPRHNHCRRLTCSKISHKDPSGTI